MIIDDSTKVRPQGARNEIMRRREMPGRQASDTAGLNARCLGRQHLRSELGLQRRILPACLPVSFVCHFRRHFLQHLTDLRTTDHVTKNTCRTPCAPSPSTGAGGDMGSQKCGIVGKSQPVLIMIDPIISTRTRITSPLAQSPPLVQTPSPRLPRLCVLLLQAIVYQSVAQCRRFPSNREPGFAQLWCQLPIQSGGAGTQSCRQRRRALCWPCFWLWLWGRGLHCRLGHKSADVRRRIAGLVTGAGCRRRRGGGSRVSLSGGRHVGARSRGVRRGGGGGRLRVVCSLRPLRSTRRGMLLRLHQVVHAARCVSSQERTRT
jgi:hypothetical protein